MSEERPSEAGGSEFERQADRARGSATGPIAEFWYFLSRSGKWWMAPIILALLTVGTVLVLSSSALAPLIYAIF